MVVVVGSSEITQKMSEYGQYVFIIGSPRSGTTLLGDLLDLHPQIGRWYEPYFVLEHHFQEMSHDGRTIEDATDEVKSYIFHEFEAYRRKRNCQFVVDKTPRNCFRILFLRQIFPDAKFIHLIRDGRDTTLSIHKEWRKREEILQRKRNVLRGLQVIKEFLDEHEFLEHKIAALYFEIGSPSNLLKGRSHLFYRLRRWKGRIGWGPQFKDWQTVIDTVSILEFNAMQWTKCIEGVLSAKHHLTSRNFLQIRYEDLLGQPKKTLHCIVDFLGTSFSDNFLADLSRLRASNINKWQSAFSHQEKRQIGPIIQSTLQDLGYVEDDSWYNQNQFLDKFL